MDHWESNRGSHARNALLGCGALWALAAAVLVFAHLLTSRETGDLMTRWDATFGSWGDTLEAWPSRGASLEALDVEQRAADLGIELAPTGSGRNGTRSTAAVALGAVRGPLAGYLVAALENPDRRSVAAPAEVRSYLESARPGLDALYARLRSGDPPRWERHLERNVQAPLPNLLGHVQIQKLMLADAIDAVATGASERSDLALEASWRLNEALRDGPHLIELLVALHITRQQAGAVRLLPAPADVWAERMQSVRYTDKVIRSLALEGRMLVEAIGAKAPPSGGVMAGTAQLLTGPYRRQCAADSGGELLERLERLSKLNHVCDRDLEALGASLSWESPWWNKLGEVAVPSLSAAVRRAARADFDAELTARLLRLDSEVGSGSGTAESFAAVVTASCPPVSWSVRTAEDGSLLFGPSRPVAWGPTLSGPALPQTYRLGLSAPR